MASEKVKQEIDQFVENCPLKRRSLMLRSRIVACTDPTDRQWATMVRDALKQDTTVYL